MPDIAMCRDSGCSLKRQCYRYTAEPKEYMQSYGIFNKDINKMGCKFFWDNADRPHKCKYVKRVGESCTLNDNCTFPDCKTK